MVETTLAISRLGCCAFMISYKGMINAIVMWEICWELLTKSPSQYIKTNLP